MATNILNLTAADAGKTLPLRGDMGVALNFTPTDNHFRVAFMTQDAGTFIIGSTARMFRALNLSAQSSLSVGGKVGLFIELMYDTDKGEFVVTKNNLVSGEAAGTGGTTGGTTGAAPTITVGQTVTGAPGTAALVENIGTPTALQLKFTIPAGQNGTNATGGGGAALPAGGTTAQYLGKTGPADGQVGWLTLPTSSGSTGTGTGAGATQEVLLTQASDGSFTPDAALGNRFRIMVTKAFTVNNPVGYTPGQDIAIALRYDTNGPYLPTWGDKYAFKDRQPPILPAQASSLVEIIARYTDDIDADNKGGWLTRVVPDASLLGYGVASFVARNTTTNVSYYVLRSSTVPAAQCGLTSIRPGQTLKILRNGLGIEAYGAIDAEVNGVGNYRITGALPNGNRAELRTGQGVRSAFDRGVLAFSGTGVVNVTVQDLILSGAREQSGASHTASGVSLTSGAAITTLRNVKIYDCENGILAGNWDNAAHPVPDGQDYSGTLHLIDCEFDGNGVGDYGFTHNIYMGHGPQEWTALRSTFKNAVGGHNIKSRAGITTLDQVLCLNAIGAREMEAPNGGVIHATNCIFHHGAQGVQNDCVAIGAEGIDTSRTREYIFRNCEFINDISFPRDVTFMWNYDTVAVTFIDCKFTGSAANNQGGPGGSAVNGIRGPFNIQNTGGPLGPLLPVGYQPIAVTPVAG